jgi:hypothetical protein
VSFEITPDLLADYNGDISLVMSPGAYELMAGSSSRDIFFTRSFSITKGTEIR